MKYKYIFIALLMIAGNYLNAQVKVLDPDNMQPIQASTGHPQTIQDILPMGNWKPNKQLDSLKIGDTLIMINDNTIRELDLNFSKDNKITRYTQHMDNTSTSLSFSNTWDAIGFWDVENGNIEFDINHVFLAPNTSKSKRIKFTEVSKSYQTVKLLATYVRIEIAQ